jgi:hypothetical protein
MVEADARGADGRRDRREEAEDSVEKRNVMRDDD